MDVDWGFWVLYLLAAGPAFLGGWMTRGMIERENAHERQEAWSRIAYEIERARRMHPSHPGSRRGDWE